MALTATIAARTTTLPGITFFLGNLLLILYAVPFVSLALFFFVTALLIYGKRWVEEREHGPYLAIAVVILLSVLFYYHSGTKSVGTASPIGWYLGKVAPSLLEYLRLPHVLSNVGISYCFLRAIYALIQPRLDLWGFTRYYFFLPTFFSGPIIRADEYLSQVPAFRRSNMAPALARIFLGAIKVSISQLIQSFIPLASAAAMSEQIQDSSVISAWGFAFAAGIWLFLNFSGFSDICIGAAKLCNITVPENFNNPFAARDITDFWRRWHMTLAAWLRTCIYTPIARILGNRFGQQHGLLHVAPPLITMLVCGLWHGISAGYILWGLMHGLGLVAHQWYKARVASRLSSRVRGSTAYAVLAWLTTHAYIAMAWVFFFPSPTPTIRLSLLYLMRMFGVVIYDVDVAITTYAPSL